jgi:hypothetical protein
MEGLQRQLSNKENQFKEMSAQLLNHLNKITQLTKAVEDSAKLNMNLKVTYQEKEEILAKLLSDKAELFEILQALENVEGEKLPEEIIKNEEAKEKSTELTEEVKNAETVEEKDLEEVDNNEEEKEEPLFSDEIDITAELEKLGIVDLVKKY